MRFQHSEQPLLDGRQGLMANGAARKDLGHLLQQRHLQRLALSSAVVGLKPWKWDFPGL